MFDFMKKKRGGFAITFEIILATLLFSLSVVVMIYLCQALEARRYLINVTLNTCELVSRYSGNNTGIWQKQTERFGSIEATVNNQIEQGVNMITREGRGLVEVRQTENSRYIEISDPSSNSGNATVTVKMNYILQPLTGGLINIRKTESTIRAEIPIISKDKGKLLGDE